MRIHSAFLVLALYGASAPLLSKANPIEVDTIDFPMLTDVGTETETESEVEVAAGDRAVAGAVALGAAVGSLQANGLAQVMVSGSVDMKTLGHMENMIMVGQQGAALRVANVVSFLCVVTTLLPVCF